MSANNKQQTKPTRPFPSFCLIVMGIIDTLAVVVYYGEIFPEEPFSATSLQLSLLVHLGLAYLAWKSSNRDMRTPLVIALLTLECAESFAWTTEWFYHADWRQLPFHLGQIIIGYSLYSMKIAKQAAEH